MSEPKAFASLSSGLLARKGAAKPAMRPQGFGQMGGMGMEDLGWNDMGTPSQAPASVHPIHPEDLPEHVPSSISALTPAPRTGPAPQAEPEEAKQSDEQEFVTEAAPPPVVEQQRAIEASFSEAKAPAPAPKAAEAQVVKLPPRPRKERGAKDKAAFTLRLDAERHLKLRLACAVTHKSAQQIVSRALEEYLASLPELDVLASKVPSKRGNA